MVTARAAQSHSCFDVGSSVSHPLCNCVKGACAQNPQSQRPPQHRVALQALEDQKAIKRGPLQQAEGRVVTSDSSVYEQRGLWYKCLWHCTCLPGRPTITGLQLFKLGFFKLLLLKSKLYAGHYRSGKLSSILKHFVCPEENHRP